jgi:hypothetical protein
MVYWGQKQKKGRFDRLNQMRSNYTLWGMAREAGFEPATDGLENHCSILLSYSRKWLTQIPQIKRNRQ